MGAKASRRIVVGLISQLPGGSNLSVPVMHNGRILAPVSQASLKGPEKKR